MLDNEPDIHTHPNPALDTLVLQQNQIGWEQILCGCFDSEWKFHDRTQPDKKQSTCGQWTTEVIIFIFEQWWTLWESRNQDRHGRDMATKLQAQALQVDRELQMFYEEFDGKVPHDLQWIFDTNIATH